MIRYLLHSQVDTERWNGCVDMAFNSNLYGYSWYLDMVCPGWCALVEDDYQRIMPLPAWQKSGISYLAQPYFTQQLGLFSISDLSQADLYDFLLHIPEQYKYIDVNLNVFNSFDTPGFINQPQVNFELDLLNPYKKVSMGYSQNLLRNIRKSGKYQHSVDKNIRPEDIIDLFRKHRGVGISTLADKQYALLLTIIYACIERDISRFWGIYDENHQLSAAVVWIFCRRKVIFFFSAVSTEGRNQGAMPFLIDTFIREHAGTGLVLDFEGSNNPDLARFYAGFGSKRFTYPRISKNNLSIPVKVALNITRYLRRIVKK